MKTITTAVIKGGTGKTATAAAIAQAAKKNGLRAIAVDMDPQANLTFSLAADQTAPGAYQLINGADPSDVIQQTAQGVDVIAASPNLSAEKTTPASANRLRIALDPVRDNYDLCIIDTPPTMGELVYNALQASDALIIPLEVDTSSIQGLYQIVEIARRMQGSRGNHVEILGTVLTRYDSRPKINRFLRDTIKEKGEAIGAPLLGEIRASVVVKEAAAFQESLFDYAPKSKPAEDYITLYKKIIERI